MCEHTTRCIHKAVDHLWRHLHVMETRTRASQKGLVWPLGDAADLHSVGDAAYSLDSTRIR